MKKILMTAAALTSIALVSAQADTKKFESIDVDQNGKISLNELIAAVPSVTEKQFAKADVNSDGGLSKKEFKNAGMN